MGAINYGSNNIIGSFGYSWINYFPSEEDIKQCREDYDLSEEDYTDEDIENRILDDSHDMMEEDMEEVRRHLCGYKYYDVKVEYGYYEGFYIDIDDKFLYLDSYEQKKEMQKELTKLKKELTYVIENFGVRVCYPGWCTGWEKEIKDSLRELNVGIQEERKRIKELRTEKQFWKLTKEERNKIYGLCF